MFTVKVTHGYADQIASAMNYLEEKRMLHRDLAVRNILVYSKDTVSVFYKSISVKAVSLSHIPDYLLI